MLIISDHLRCVKHDFDAQRMVQLAAQTKAVRCQQGHEETVIGTVARPTGMIVVGLGGASTLISDRLACSRSRLDGLQPEKMTKPEQMGPDTAHPNVDQKRQLGSRWDSDPQQGQERAFVLTGLVDPGRRCCDWLPERRPQHLGHADQAGDAHQGGPGAKRRPLQPHLEA
jgi:hypothetical protein